MRIKTDFWHQTDLERWRHNYSTLAWIMMLLALANMLYGIYKASAMITILNLVFAITGALMYISYNRYNKAK